MELKSGFIVDAQATGSLLVRLGHSLQLSVLPEIDKPQVFNLVLLLKIGH